jgi:hypothetical protein
LIDQGEVVSKALDFVTKEIQRMQQESRVAHLVSQATDTRRRREAEEAGRRQAEYLNRKKREEYHAALMRENSASAGRFLDEIFDVAVETVSGKQAGEGTIVNSTMDSMVQTIEDEENDAATVVTDLLSQFLFPELARRQEKAVAQVEDRKYIDAAHNIVCNLVGAVAEKTANGEEKPTTRRGRSRTRGMSVSARNRSSSTR